MPDDEITYPPVYRRSIVNSVSRNLFFLIRGRAEVAKKKLREAHQTPLAQYIRATVVLQLTFATFIIGRISMFSFIRLAFECGAPRQRRPHRTTGPRVAYGYLSPRTAAKQKFKDPLKKKTCTPFCSTSDSMPDRNTASGKAGNSRLTERHAFDGRYICGDIPKRQSCTLPSRRYSNIYNRQFK